jgi:hypothetical protein
VPDAFHTVLDVGQDRSTGIMQTQCPTMAKVTAKGRERPYMASTEVPLRLQNGDD